MQLAVLTPFDDGHSDDFSLRGPFREKHLSIPAAAGSSRVNPEASREKKTRAPGSPFCGVSRTVYGM